MRGGPPGERLPGYAYSPSSTVFAGRLEGGSGCAATRQVTSRTPGSSQAHPGSSPLIGPPPRRGTHLGGTPRGVDTSRPPPSGPSEAGPLAPDVQRGVQGGGEGLGMGRGTASQRLSATQTPGPEFGALLSAPLSTCAGLRISHAQAAPGPYTGTSGPVTGRRTPSGPVRLQCAQLWRRGEEPLC